MKQWTSFVAFLLVLLFALCADGLMDKLGLMGFAAVGLAVLGAAGALVEVGEEGI